MCSRDYGRIKEGYLNYSGEETYEVTKGYYYTLFLKEKKE